MGGRCHGGHLVAAYHTTCLVILEYLINLKEMTYQLCYHKVCMSFGTLFIHPEAQSVYLQNGGNDFYLIRMCDVCEKALNV